MALACGVLLLLEFVLGPHLLGAKAPTWGEILENLFLELLTSILGATLIGTFLIWLMPQNDSDQAEHVRVVPARERGEFLESCRANTDVWWFNGGMGRFNISVTLPDLARRARRENGNKSVVLVMLDPDNDRACENYSRLRLGLRSGAGADWSARRVRTELLASILSATCWIQKEPLLEVAVALKSHVSLTRFDLSSNAVLMTTEDAHESALAFHRGSPYYRLIRENLRLDLSQARRLSVPPQMPSFAELTVDSAKAALSGLGLRTHDLADADFTWIVNKVINPENPYA